MKPIFSIFFLMISLSIPINTVFAKGSTGEEPTLLSFCQRPDLTSDQLHTLEVLKNLLEENDCEGLEKKLKKFRNYI